MPRIDPLSLLKCLSVLLGPNGGIKSKEEVIRLANLMTKFSKKLVSKCIYIQILKSTSSDLLSQFMGAGGWNLVHMWLTDGILAKNWALIQELLELLLLCPVDVERLKSNNCPKLIKGLSKEGSHHGVRTLASRLVEQWLKIVKGEAAPNSVPAAIMTIPITNNVVQNSTPLADAGSKSIASRVSDPQVAENAPSVQQTPAVDANQPEEKVQRPASPQSAGSVYKITIRNGNQVLANVETDASNISHTKSVNSNEVNGEVVDDAPLVKKEEPEKVSDERTSGTSESAVNELSKKCSSEVKVTSSSKDISETDSAVKTKGNKDVKDEKDVSSDSSKSTSDKENRDLHRKDEKKSSSTDKKSSSSSKSSSKHSSSRSGSSSHRSSSHKSSSSTSKDKSSSSKDKSSKDRSKEKERHSSKSSSSSTSKSKTERDKEKEKERQKKDQAEKDKATLEKVQGPALSVKLGKIPKKKVEEGESARKLVDTKDSFKENKDKLDIKKIPPPEKKTISMSIENRKNSNDTVRPKTVKTFNSKFRSTGLEEEVKPPPPRGVKKPNPPTLVIDKKVILPKLPLKRSSPVRESFTAEKRARLANDLPVVTPAEEKKGGIKLIPPKPKPMVLQESDMFMDALMTATSKSKEPRKRKRRPSISKDGPSEAKKAETSSGENNRDGSPPASDLSPDAKDKDSDDKKPSFKFYQETLEIDEDKEVKGKTDDAQKESDEETEDGKAKPKEENNVEDGSRTPTPEDDIDDMKSSASPEDPAAEVAEALKKVTDVPLENRPDVLRSVLVHQKRKGPKKVLKWKTDLESIRYFELDETERVNVTKTFTDAKQMEKQHEREAFQMGRKLSTEDTMEEKTRWRSLIPIDLPPPLVDLGKDSREKDIQYAREKGILQALYFNRSMIPDSPSEPDEERHHVMTDPKMIPLDDLMGNKDTEKDFTAVPWPEPKPQLPMPSAAMPTNYFQPFRQTQQPMIPPLNAQQHPPIGQIAPQIMVPMSAPPTHPDIQTNAMSTTGGGWRSGDGKLVMPDANITPMTNAMPTTYPPAGMDGNQMVPPNLMAPPMYNQDGYVMQSEEMNYNFQGPPPGQGMYPPNCPPPGPPGPPPPPPPPFQGPRGPIHGNRGRGGPPGGWFRGGGPPRGMPWRGGWRGSGKQPPVCRAFSKNGYCRVGDKCQYLHPGVNCPPY